MASVRSHSDQTSSSASEDLDNLQLDIERLDDFDLMKLEEETESLEKECLALEAQGPKLDPMSIFAKNCKPAAKPEPGEVTEDTKPKAKTEGLDSANSQKWKNDKH